jgi:drug/metabolite transporter (DMT)-like permease
LAFGAAGVVVILASLFFATGARQYNGVGISLALLSGLTYGGVVMFLRRLRDENAAWLIALNLLVTAVILLPYVAYVAAIDGRYPSPLQFAVLACFGALQIGLPYLLFAFGLKRVASQEAAGLALLEPVLMPLWVWLAWKEQPADATMLGAVLILAGLVARYAAPTPNSTTATNDAAPQSPDKG